MTSCWGASLAAILLVLAVTLLLFGAHVHSRWMFAIAPALASLVFVPTVIVNVKLSSRIDRATAKQHACSGPIEQVFGLDGSERGQHLINYPDVPNGGPERVPDWLYNDQDVIREHCEGAAQGVHHEILTTAQVVEAFGTTEAALACSHRVRTLMDHDDVFTQASIDICELLLKESRAVDEPAIRAALSLIEVCQPPLRMDMQSSSCQRRRHPVTYYPA